MTHSLPTELEEVLNDLGRCIEAFGPYTQTAVLTGGLAALLYRWYLPGSGADRPPLTTFDMDWALPSQLGHIGGEGLHQRLTKGGFNFRLRGAGKEPITYYQRERHGTDRQAPIYAEFITPRSGSAVNRQGINQGIYRNIMRPTPAPTEAAISRVLKHFSEATGLLNR